MSPMEQWMAEPTAPADSPIGWETIDVFRSSFVVTDSGASGLSMGGTRGVFHTACMDEMLNHTAYRFGEDFNAFALHMLVPSDLPSPRVSCIDINLFHCICLRERQ